MELHRGRLHQSHPAPLRGPGGQQTLLRDVARRARARVGGAGPGFDLADELCLTPAGVDPTSRIHLAFQTDSRAVVDLFHAAASGGGRDNGGPAERRYHPGYYAAFLLDPDGNNIEAVHHGAATRSAPSIVITPAAPPHA